MNQLSKIVRKLSLGQIVIILASAGAIAGGLVWFTHWNREQNFRPLYTGLAAEDAGAVVAKLREQNIEHRLADNGATIKVAAERVSDARLSIAMAGLPKTGRIGFELFDTTNFGLTEFAEQVNFRRAMEGELERSIMTLAEVERARVHISLPKDSVFLESKQEAKASVVLKLRARVRLSSESAAAICQLVASAVDRLSPSAVSVLDTNGNLLVRARPAQADAGVQGSELELEHKQKVERDLVSKVRATLEPLLGSDNFRAGASVEFDFSETEQTEETYDPNKSAVLTSQKSEDIAGANQASGLPGTPSNLPRPVARPAVGASGVSRKTENLTYQPSKVVRHVRLPRGSVKRMSLSVLVGQTVRWQGTGAKAKRILDSPSPEKLKAIREVVAAATGFSEQRGDQLIVQTLPFEWALNMEPPAETVPAPAVVAKPWEKLLPKMPVPLLIGLAVGVLLTLLAPIVWLAARSGRRKKTGTLQQAPALPSGGLDAPETGLSFESQLTARKAEIQKQEQEILKSLLPPIETTKGDVLVKQLKKLSKENPVAVAQLLRTWIQDS